MSIKQNGGVFGRNPTFNDVTIEGQLTFNGDIDINSDLKVDGDIETTGDVIIATSGKGIDFSATSGTGTSELLDDYEEGTWTPSPLVSGSISVADARYTKVGRQVTVMADVTAIVTTSGDWTGLPFTAGAEQASGVVGYQSETASVVWSIMVDGSSTNFTFRQGSSGKQLTAGSRAVFNATYFV